VFVALLNNRLTLAPNSSVLGSGCAGAKVAGVVLGELVLEVVVAELTAELAVDAPEPGDLAAVR
jgi:hypothetical protein